MSSTASSSATASLTASVSASASAAASSTTSNPAFKIVGICLAVGSGLFIGTSFVVKKKGLLSATAKHGNTAGEGHAYLKSPLWWTGMTLMIIGEILNFVAYAFTEAILVTPMGAMSVVVAAILSHFLLKEKLTFFGWIGCTLCIIGSVILALNAPEEQSATTIAEFQRYFVSAGFLTWASLCIVGSLVVIFYVAPRWGKKNMMPYISVCSIIGGISVSCTQGLGASIITSIQGDNQVKNWFFWFLFGFVVITLLTEINYLNKALELFNTSMVVPVYFCYFTSATMITSFILYQGLKASAVDLITMVLGFLVTCLGITLLQMSKVDPEKLSGLDRRTTILLQAARHGSEAEENGEVTALEEPGMDALRGGFGAVGSIIRARSVSRRMSNASSVSGLRQYPFNTSSNLSTHGLDQLQRYQLTDNPMPNDAMDQISLHTGGSVGSAPRNESFSSGQLNPLRSKSHLKFEESDVVHQYGYTQHDGQTDATHSVRPHFSLSMFNQPRSTSVPAPRTRQSSLGESHVVYPVPEVDEQVLSSSPEETHLDHDEKADFYHDPYHSSPIEAAEDVDMVKPPRAPSKHGISQLLRFGSGPDLSLRKFSRDYAPDPSQLQHHSHNESDVRGGAHRGTRDYPHLPKQDKAVEREERAALVEHGGEDEEEEDSTEAQYDEEGDLSSRYATVGSSSSASARGRPGAPLP